MHHKTNNNGKKGGFKLRKKIGILLLVTMIVTSFSLICFAETPNQLKEIKLTINKKAVKDKAYVAPDGKIYVDLSKAVKALGLKVQYDALTKEEIEKEKALEMAQEGAAYDEKSFNSRYYVGRGQFYSPYDGYDTLITGKNFDMLIDLKNNQMIGSEYQIPYTTIKWADGKTDLYNITLNDKYAFDTDITKPNIFLKDKVYYANAYVLMVTPGFEIKYDQKKQTVDISYKYTPVKKHYFGGKWRTSPDY